MGDTYLECIRGLVIEEFDEVLFVKGKRYKVVGEDAFGYCLVTEQGDEHLFTKEKDPDGVNYRKWFRLV